MQIVSSPQSVIGVLRNSLILFKKSWLKLLPVAALIVGLLTVLNMFLPKQATTLLMVTQHMSIKLLIMIVGLIFIMFWLFLALFYKCYRILIAADIKYSMVFLVATFRFFPSILVLFLSMLLVILGTICFVIPGIFLVFLLAYSFLTTLIDNKNAFSSLKYSIQLVWGNWWRTFAVFLIVFVCMMIIMLVAIVSVNFVVMSLLHFKLTQATMTMNMMVIVLPLFMWIILINVFVCQYYDLKLRYQIKSG